MFLFLFQWSIITNAQQQAYLPLNRDIYSNYLPDLNSLASSFHTSVKPFRVNELNEILNIDSIDSTKYFHYYSSKWKRKLLYENFASIDTGIVKLKLDPLFNFQIGRDLHDGSSSFNNTRGIVFNGEIGNKLSFSTSFYENQAVFVGYVNDYVAANYVIPGQGYRKVKSNGDYDYSMASSYLSYTPSKYFNLTFGHDKNFIGDGYRSLLLSDNAFNYPFLKLTTNFWKIKYVNIYTQFRDIRTFTNGSGFQKKYGAFHYLSLDVNKRFKLGLFESVMWQGSDTAISRGYDLSYLNPIIFLRPVEFSNGSPDNVSLGFNLKFKLTDNNNLYGQIMVDEFVLEQVLKNTGWWANKFGFQIGEYASNIFGVKDLCFQTEFNYVRPYTYAHDMTTSNYGHLNQSLAHPLGANFMESVSFVKYNYKRFFIEAKFLFTIHGVDTAGMNYGSDIYKSYLNHPMDQGNYVGQGLKTRLSYRDLRLVYLVNPKTNLNIEIGISNRIQSSNVETLKTNFIFIGIRTSLLNYYYDF